MREQFFLAAVAQNIKRLVRFLRRPTTPTVEARLLTEVKRETRQPRSSQPKDIPIMDFFNTHSCLRQLSCRARKSLTYIHLRYIGY